MAPSDAETLRHAAVAHDIGKIAVPDRILLKPGALDRRRNAKRCNATPMIGASMLGGSESEVMQLAETIAHTHHERWDGTGYPRGLSGEDIPLAGRVCAVCDVFDALLSERPYKPAWTFDDALAEITLPSGQPLRPDRGRRVRPDRPGGIRGALPRRGASRAPGTRPRWRSSAGPSARS